MQSITAVTSAAAFALFDAELARQGLRPTRVFSDGTALPSSFNEIRARHDQATTDPRLNPDIPALDRNHDQQVSRFDTTLPRDANASQRLGIRDDVRGRGRAIRSQAGAAGSEFDAKAQIVETSDGALASRRSLLKQTGKQVAEDAGAAAEDATATVRRLLQQDK